MSSVKEYLSRIFQKEDGIAFPVVLAMLTLGGLVIVPTLNYVATNADIVKMYEQKFKGYYAAEAGIEDALWRIKTEGYTTLPYAYELTGINNMSVNISIDEVTEIAGVAIGEEGVHEGWLKLTKAANYDSGIYTFTLSVKNNGGGMMKIEKLLIDFPKHLGYVEGSTISNITSDDPDVIGVPDTGITCYYDIPSPFFSISPGITETLILQLDGPVDIDVLGAHAVIKASREDIGTVWDGDSKPFGIIAEAKDSTGKTLAVISTGVWKGANLEISCWQINP